MSGAARRQRGLSLIELLVSVVIGMMVVVAVVMAFLGSGRTQRRLAAVTQMNEEAQLALNFIKREVQMAGAVDPVGTSATAVARFRGVEPPLFRPLSGCSAGFANPTAARGGAGCRAQGTTPSHALESNYQVLQSTLVVGEQGQPMDCAGQGVTFQPMQASGNPSITVDAAFVTSRLYVDTSGTTGAPQLKCAGASSGPIALADNVESMTLWFGISPGWDRTSRPTKRPVRFVSLDSLDSMGAPDWSNVVAVRVCLQMRSAEAVLGKDEDVAEYRDCTGVMKASDDGRLRSAFFATATVRNRVGF